MLTLLDGSSVGDDDGDRCQEAFQMANCDLGRFGTGRYSGSFQWLTVLLSCDLNHKVAQQSPGAEPKIQAAEPLSRCLRALAQPKIRSPHSLQRCT